MQRPVIGISSNYIFAGSFGAAGGVRSPRQDWCSVSTDYLNAVAQAGGLPVMLPVLAEPELLAEIVSSLDGILLTGGGDLDPALFGELPHGKIGEICPQRDRCDLWLVRAALAGDIPLLAVCRGIQVLNVACGGTIYQDIGAQAPEAFNHTVIRVPKWYGVHRVTFAAGSLAARICGEEARVNSFHHQAVKAVAPSLYASGRSDDGLVEAVESPAHAFVLGVQWHPEMMAAEDRTAAGIFAALTAAARVYGERRAAAKAKTLEAGRKFPAAGGDGCGRGCLLSDAGKDDR